MAYLVALLISRLRAGLRHQSRLASSHEQSIVRKNLLMKLAFTIIVSVALASNATVAEATNSSASNQVSTPHNLGNRTNLAQRKKIPKPPYQSDPMKQYEQDKAKGWYKADRA